MKTAELQGKRFLEYISKMEAQLDEKNDELAYWEKQKNIYKEDETIAQTVERRSEELQGMIRLLTEQKLSATNHFMITN